MSKYSTVVLVDDNETTSFYNEDLLSDSRLFEKTIVIRNGTDTIAYFKALKKNNTPLPELVILDIKMPDFDGFEVLDQIEEMEFENLNSMCLCILTTSRHQRDLEQFERYDIAKEFIEKPLTISKLQNIISTYL